MTPTDLMHILVGLAVVIIVASLGILIWRAVATHNDARRAVVADMAFMTLVGLFLCYSLFHATAITFDVALFAGLFGALSTIAYARIISRGRR